MQVTIYANHVKASYFFTFAYVGRIAAAFTLNNNKNLIYIAHNHTHKEAWTEYEGMERETAMQTSN